MLNCSWFQSFVITGAYAPEKHQTPKHPQPPSYSFGSRTPYHKKDATPAPNAYGLPNILGPKAVGKRSYPAYTMTARSKIGSFHEDLQKVWYNVEIFRIY